MGALRRLGRWCFVNRRTGAVTVAQWPNVALWVFLASSLVLRVLHPHHGLHPVLTVVAVGSLLVWAVDEVVRGVNPFRRLLGLVVLGFTVAGLVVR